MQSKKQLILWILSILENETDMKNPKTQVEIAEIISKVYPCERKTVCRNIKFLKEMGYPIEKTTKGFYMNRKRFSQDEVAFVKKAILFAEGKSDEEKQKLAESIVYILAKQYINSR